MVLNRIVFQFLNDNKFDGLINKSCECACNKNDLAPCGQPSFVNCEAAYITEQPPLGSVSNCDDYFTTNPQRKIKHLTRQIED